MRNRRFTQPKKPREAFLVLCEGETEKEYVALLRQHFQLPITIKTIVTGNSISSRLISQYRNEMKLSKEDVCHVFFIYDGDIPDITNLIEGLEGKPIITTPSIELWFILHNMNYQKHTDTGHMPSLLKSSHPAFKNYCKGKLSIDQRKLLLCNMGIACERSRKLPAHKNPSSDFHLFIETLEKVRKR